MCTRMTTSKRWAEKVPKRGDEPRVLGPRLHWQDEMKLHLKRLENTEEAFNTMRRLRPILGVACGPCKCGLHRVALWGAVALGVEKKGRTK